MMHEFSPKALGDLIYAADTSRRGVLSQNHLRRNYLNWVSERVSSGTYDFAPLMPHKINTFTVYRVRHLGDELVLRLLADRIKRAYRVKQSDRHAISRQIKLLLADSTYKSVLKLDISKFYESVSRTQVLARLEQDAFISREATLLLQKFFRSTENVMTDGLPRGIGLSAVLSELYLKDFDRRVRSIPGVYFATRYVDDMLVFSTGESHIVRPSVQALLPAGLSMNEAKSVSIQVGCRCYNKCIHKPACPCRDKCVCHGTKKQYELTFLGYQYKFEAPNKYIADPLKITVHLGHSKADRIKKRIIGACKDHIRAPQFALLQARLRFLTENHRIHGARNYGKLLTGIGYNYRLVTDARSFQDLDSFLRAALSSESGAFGLAMRASMNPTQWRSLMELSFTSGFKSRRVRRLTPGAARAIRSCWD